MDRLMDRQFKYYIMPPFGGIKIQQLRMSVVLMDSPLPMGFVHNWVFRSANKQCSLNPTKHFDKIHISCLLNLTLSLVEFKPLLSEKLPRNNFSIILGKFIHQKYPIFTAIFTGEISIKVWLISSDLILTNSPRT